MGLSEVASPTVYKYWGGGAEYKLAPAKAFEELFVGAEDLMIFNIVLGFTKHSDFKLSIVLNDLALVFGTVKLISFGSNSRKLCFVLYCLNGRKQLYT